MKRLHKIISMFLVWMLCVPMLPGSALALELPELVVLGDTAKTVEMIEIEPVEEAITIEESKCVVENDTEEAQVLYNEGTVVASGICGKDVTWTLRDDGMLTISGIGAMYDFSDTSYVPWYYCRSSIIGVVIEDGVNTIGNYAFCDYDSLTSIIIPNSVTSVGDYAFRYCDNLLSITIPDSVTSIGKRAFSECWNLASITIGNSVTTIGEYAFCFCDRLTNIIVPSSVTTIDSYAFYGCNSLTSITIPNSIAYIGNYAFQACGNLAEVYIEDVVAWCGISFGNRHSNPLCYGATLYLNGKPLLDIIIPNGITTVGDYTFCGYNRLINVTIPDSVTTIGGSAFYGCSNLINISIPNGVTIIDEYAFYDCDGLTNIVIPDSVTSVGGHAFQYCSNLLSVTISGGMDSVGERAFYYCNTLEHILFIGTETQWAGISIGTDNAELISLMPCFGGESDAVIECEDCESTYLYCSVCESVFNVVNKGGVGHVFGEWYISKAATCKEPGEKRRDCTGCEHYETEVNAAFGHTEVTDAAVAATCTTTGLTEGSHCSVCGEVLVVQEIIPIITIDINGDGSTNAFDLVALMKHIVGAETAANADALDVNGDDKVDVLDVIRFVRLLA